MLSRCVFGARSRQDIFQASLLLCCRKIFFHFINVFNPQSDNAIFNAKNLAQLSFYFWTKICVCIYSRSVFILPRMSQTNMALSPPGLPFHLVWAPSFVLTSFGLDLGTAALGLFGALMHPNRNRGYRQNRRSIQCKTMDRLLFVQAILSEHKIRTVYRKYGRFGPPGLPFSPAVVS